MIPPNPVLGTSLLAAAAGCGAVCYTPQRAVRQWAWQSYWLVQALFCWMIWPVVGAALTIPNLPAVLAAAPARAMWASFLPGAAYGVGGTAFGLAIRHMGFSLTYSIVIGISAVLGTVVPPAVRGTLGAMLRAPGAGWVVAGIGIGIAGISLCGWAGRKKERDLAAGAGVGSFNIARGLPLAIVAGVLSAVYGFALEAGQPIAAIAAEMGAGHFRGNVIYIFSNTGALLTTAAYCLYLGIKERTMAEYVRLPADAPRGTLGRNYLMAILTGTLWYGQFFLYNLGYVRMGAFQFTSWAILMILIVLCSNVLGMILKEWSACRPATRWIIRAGMAVLVLAVLAITWGNRLAELHTAP
jgi:L-rhamnose-H+ transport protein